MIAAMAFVFARKTPPVNLMKTLLKTNCQIAEHVPRSGSESTRPGRSRCPQPTRAKKGEQKADQIDQITFRKRKVIA